MSLVILFFLLLYLAVLVAATVLGYRWGKSQGWSPNKCRWTAVVAFLVVFLPMFWDWLPTVWLHSYYCDNYGGLTVYKTPEQWKHENPGVAESLIRQKPPLQVGAGDKYYFQLNQRFRWQIEHTEKPLWLRQNEDRIVDSETGRVLVRFIDFSTGIAGPNASSRGFRDIKVWMNRNYCESDRYMAGRKEFGQLRLNFETLGGQ